jgi:copper(I)-binding protein
VKRRLALAVFVACAGIGRASAAPSISVTDAWSRPAASTGTAVMYATIKNAAAVPDRLTAATTPSARNVELHQSMSSMMNGDPVASMHPVDAIVVPAHGSVTLAPGGYHLMLTGLKGDLTANGAFLARLHFANAGWIVTIVHVRAI